MKISIFKYVKILLNLYFILCPLLNVQAQTISGKWKCSKELLDGMRLRYKEMRGCYKFKKNGKFTFYVSGRRAGKAKVVPVLETGGFKKFGSRQNIVTIKVKGTYKIENNMITTQVDPKKVKVYVSSGRRSRLPADYINDSDIDIKFHDMQDVTLRSIKTMADAQENMIREEKTYLWNWHNLPITITGDSAMIGEKIKLYR